jgi:hypothetical protein
MSGQASTRSAIRPAAESEDFICERADDIMHPGVMFEQIDAKTEQASVIGVDLTDRNPNVMQELGFARRARKAMVKITQEARSSLPFDIRHYRVLPSFYLSEEELAALRKTLAGTHDRDQGYKNPGRKGD